MTQPTYSKHHQPPLLLTRPYDQSVEFSRDLTGINVQTLIYPFMTIHIQNFDLDFLQSKLNGRKIILTSLHGAEFLNKHMAADLDQFEILLIGDILKQKTQDMGFTNSQQIGENSQDLYEYLKKSGDKFVYIRGEDISLDLSKALPSQGIDVLAYRAIEVEEDFQDLQNVLRQEKCKMGAFFSKRSVQLFAQWVKKFNLVHACQDFSFFALSPSIAEVISQEFTLDLGQIYICSKPSRSDMITLIEQCTKDQIKIK